MTWIMVGVTAVAAGLQIGGKIGKNKDAETAGGLLSLLGSVGGGMGGGGEGMGGLIGAGGEDAGAMGGLFGGGGGGGMGILGGGEVMSGGGGGGMLQIPDVSSLLKGIGSGSSQGAQGGGQQAPAAPTQQPHMLPTDWRSLNMGLPQNSDAELQKLLSDLLNQQYPQ